MNRHSPEAVGCPSGAVLCFYRRLEAYRLSTHGVILARGDRVFSECYFAPFTAETKHRMYSVSKTFVAAAVLFCIQDGLLTPDTPISDFFPYPSHDTVRSLLMMETTATDRGWWFGEGCRDRTETCFPKSERKLPLTQFDYDSQGSYLLGVIVEKLTGRPFLSYLQEKVLKELGFSQDAYCLQVPGGHSFGDSGVMCTPRDLFLFARLLMNGGRVGSRQYLRRDLVEQMIDCRTVTDDYGFAASDSHGYGWQIWGAPRGGFAMLGMGGQLAVCFPKEDLILILTSDNQGNGCYRDQVYGALIELLDCLRQEPLPENPDAAAELADYERSRKLFCLCGKTDAPIRREIDGRTFVCRDNPMGWKRFRLRFSGTDGRLDYENGSGSKAFTFGLGYNLFAPFPESGYSGLTAGTTMEGNRYQAAFSADWAEERKLRIRVQIIDRYLGNLAITFGFADAQRVTVRMKKAAEAFLDNYQGVLVAEASEAAEIWEA